MLLKSDERKDKVAMKKQARAWYRAKSQRRGSFVYLCEEKNILRGRRHVLWNLAFSSMKGAEQESPMNCQVRIIPIRPLTSDEGSGDGGKVSLFHTSVTKGLIPFSVSCWAFQFILKKAERSTHLLFLNYRGRIQPLITMMKRLSPICNLMDVNIIVSHVLFGNVKPCPLSLFPIEKEKIPRRI